MTVTFRGVDEFLSGLDRFAADVDELPELGEVGELIALGAAERAPRDTGELAGSVTSRLTDGTVSVFATAGHAAPIIVGVPSHSISPHPFIQASLAAREGQVVTLLEGAVQNAADRAGL